MSELLVKSESLVAVADSIRSKTGSTEELVFPEGFVEAVEGISSGDTSSEDGLITRTHPSYTNDRVTHIGKAAFFSYTSLTTVNFPVVTDIGSFAFQNCTALRTVNIPAATRISNSAFNNCTALTTASFPAVNYIGKYAFQSCSALTTVSFPVATRIDDGAFQRCTAFATVNFPVASYISNYAFQLCSALSSLYLTSPSVCTLNNSNAFASTPFAGYSDYFSGTPYIYVPTSLVDAYKSATNWAYFSSYITGY